MFVLFFSQNTKGKMGLHIQVSVNHEKELRSNQTAFPNKLQVLRLVKKWVTLL